MTDSAFRAMSVEEYLRTEEQGVLKHEYVNGFMYALHGQAGASDAHATITGNVFAALRLLARRQSCFAYAADMRVTTADRRTYYYPDVLVTCEPREDDAKFKVAPCLLVEVLSKSTAHTDHNAKYHAYTALPSLQTYLLIEQGERRVYAYGRGDTGWELREYSTEAVPLPCLGASLSLDEIYEDVR
ncbi:Uma2 family endonuclease [Deinococcus sp.]|uniref:Uma2 family endonuclease n=1 Tax=Deinococcus sp. TaxID=47478 RepID=UPI0025DEA953|nr:Uma2 family endonuclease [Deinococcus sp.]